MAVSKFAESAHVKDMLAFLRLPKTIAIRWLRYGLHADPRRRSQKASQCIDALEVSTTGVDVLRQFRAPPNSKETWNQC